MATRPKQVDPTLVPLADAARLLGIHPERLRQLQRSGHIARAPRRGFVSVIAAISGYVLFLKEDSADGLEPSAAARSHAAKAALVGAATVRRRAALTEQQEAIDAIETVAASAARRLRAARLAPDLPSATAAAFKAEIEASLVRISSARKAALLAIKTGDFAQIEGPGHGR